MQLWGMWKTSLGFEAQLTRLWMIKYRTKVPLPVDMWKNAVDNERVEIKVWKAG